MARVGDELMSGRSPSNRQNCCLVDSDCRPMLPGKRPPRLGASPDATLVKMISSARTSGGRPQTHTPRRRHDHRSHVEQAKYPISWRRTRPRRCEQQENPLAAGQLMAGHSAVPGDRTRHQRGRGRAPPDRTRVAQRTGAGPVAETELTGTKASCTGLGR